jgi:hypothetical protein
MFLDDASREVSNRSSIDRAVKSILDTGNGSLRITEDAELPDPKESVSSNREGFDQLDYAPGEEEFLAEQFYASRFSYDEQLHPERKVQSQYVEGEEDYVSEACSDTHSETMTTEEARNMVQEVQYAVCLGNLGEISFVKRAQFSVWEKTNKTELLLFHKLHGLTDDIDYSRLF